MPKHRLVPTLQTLSLRGVGSLVTSLAPHIATKLQHYDEPSKILTVLYECVSNINQTLVSHVPFYLYNSMAAEVLLAIKTLIEKTKKTYYPNANMSIFLTHMNVAVSLTEVVLSPQLKHIDFTEWPKIMRYVLYKNLSRMEGLELLNLGSCTGGWHSVDYYKIAMMTNLRSLCLCFDCTDHIIQLVADNCPHIQVLDVTSSRSVTDRSVQTLLKCAQLRELQLHRTSVSIEGLGQILIGLVKLQDLGRCDEFSLVMDFVQRTSPNSAPFGLKKIQARTLFSSELQTLVEMFPKAEFINLLQDERTMDYRILASLRCLKDVKLMCCAFKSHFLSEFLQIHGCFITNLHLEHADELDFSALVHISQCCPNLKGLVLYNCDIGGPQRIDSVKYKVPPFYSLQRLFWVVDCARSHLEFILRHAVNIQYVHLGSSTGITHEAIVNILTVNPMVKLEELRILFSTNMSMKTLELLLGSCTNLRVLSELESWQGISIDELKQFKEHIADSNFDLDIRPTLSYY